LKPVMVNDFGLTKMVNFTTHKVSIESVGWDTLCSVSSVRPLVLSVQFIEAGLMLVA